MKPTPSQIVAAQVDPAPLNDEWFAPSQRYGADPTQAAPRRGLTFTLVSVALVGFTLGGCLFLWRNESLPRWTGTAPTEVGTTTITNAPLAPVAIAAVITEEPKSTAVDLLPSPPPPAPQAAITTATVARAQAPKVAPAAPRVTTPAATELRGVDPSEAPASTESSAPAPAATVAPTVDPDPGPVTQ